MTLEEQIKSLDDLKAEADVETMLLIEKALKSDDADSIIAASKYLKRIEDRGQSNQKSYLYDPLILTGSNGYKNNPYNLSYDTLRRMGSTPIIKAIIETRVEQVATFSDPQEDEYSTGFVIKKRKPIGIDKEPKLTKQDHYKIEFLTNFILNAGVNANAWHGDTFDSYLRKTVKDSLIFDQDCAEIIPDRRGFPTEYVSVDASTIRLADNDESNILGLRNKKNDSAKIKGYLPTYVQIYQDRVVADFYPWEMIFGVRNPTTNIKTYGYGQSELESLIGTITSMLNADEYNRRVFSNSTLPKGILTSKKPMNDTTLQDFRQRWLSQMAGIKYAHSLPFLPGDELSFIDFSKSNRDMEYMQYLEFLIKVACAIYKIDPAEIGFPMAGGVDQKFLFEGNNETRLQYSRDKGLKPLLKHKAFNINKYIIQPLASEFYFSFAGLSNQNEKSDLDDDIKRLGAYMTINEIREKRGLKPILGGDIVANQYFKKVVDTPENPDPALETEDPDEEDPFEKSLNHYIDTKLTYER